MKQTDVIIIGAGAAGLMAAYALIKAGKTVTVLEARNRLGGRILTLNNDVFTQPTELGAEFVHGNLPVTLSLLKEAGIATTGVDFEMWQHKDGSFIQSNAFIDGWDALLKALNELQHDVPLQDFLDEHFAGSEYAKMRTQVQNYVAGYDTADINDVSAFALRNEWNHEDEDAQHRVTGGYCRMINYLAQKCRDAGNDILINNVVNNVQWHNNNITVSATNGSTYNAAKVIVALPLGVLQAAEGAEGTILFNPPVQEQLNAINNIGFGAVIKILLEFDTVFWESDAVTKQLGANLSTMGFLFTNEAIPTFWTQAPAHSPLITGWLGGPPAYHVKDAFPKDVLQQALTSLSNVFKIAPDSLKQKLVAWHVANWTAEPYTRGSYAYDKVASAQARKLLQQPVNDTLYFAGEYLYDGPAMGTVEAALTSGRNVAEKILKL
ncbi:FAD-dependent oxidoreductase [Flavobacterium zepuense]|uniref:Tryptophan 2-monooxygenase n=1 Tax=Flavobacterium zepuense TaxID=2593302 RepID=A0A552V4G6_9FLAO|nr:NAD(P)/FAD-dependent oxidoreductase [Flavobacterium zepuense]TRW25331.1 FAD-dependent oxidoreductase [Flavobacterium zepuense]